MVTANPLSLRNQRSTTELSQQKLYQLLSNQRRRFTIHYLQQHEQETDLSTLAETIARWEAGVDAETITHRQRKSVYTSLQQSHLPKLDDAGIVDFNRRASVVAPTDQLQTISIYTEVVSDRDIAWSKYYLTLSGMMLLVVAAAQFNLGPFTLLPDLSAGVFGAVAVLISGTVHTLSMKRMRLGETPTPPEVTDNEA